LSLADPGLVAIPVFEGEKSGVGWILNYACVME